MEPVTEAPTSRALSSLQGKSIRKQTFAKNTGGGGAYLWWGTAHRLTALSKAIHQLTFNFKVTYPNYNSNRHRAVRKEGDEGSKLIAAQTDPAAPYNSTILATYTTLGHFN